MAEFLAANHASLLRRVLAWQEVVYTDKNLPGWLADSLINNLYLLPRGISAFRQRLENRPPAVFSGNADLGRWRTVLLAGAVTRAGLWPGGRRWGQHRTDRGRAAGVTSPPNPRRDALILSGTEK